MLCRVALVNTNVLEERVASIIRVITMDDLAKTLTVTINDIVFLRSVLRLLVTAKVLLSSPIVVTMMMEALRSSETSGLTRAIRRHILLRLVVLQMLQPPSLEPLAHCEPMCRRTDASALSVPCAYLHLTRILTGFVQNYNTGFCRPTLPT
jgi:hypothetical protein